MSPDPVRTATLVVPRTDRKPEDASSSNWTMIRFDCGLNGIVMVEVAKTANVMVDPAGISTTTDCARGVTQLPDTASVRQIVRSTGGGDAKGGMLGING